MRSYYRHIPPHKKIYFLMKPHRIHYRKLGEAGLVMDKVVIMGVFDFVNFHVCKALLDKGIEVRGVQIDTDETGEDSVEKKLEIGRNSNFTEVSIAELPNDTTEKETIIISVYDLYMRYKEDILLNEAILSKFIKIDQWDQIVLLVPSQLLTIENELEAEAVIKNFIKRISTLNKKIQLLYLPTIYGPWQPDTFLFQHSILTEMNRDNPFKGLREETNDALFIDDTVEAIIEIVDRKEPGRYLLQSGKKNQWDLCAAFLKISNQIKNNRNVEMAGDEITKLTVKSTIPISVALTKQIDHVQRLIELDE
jgi:nucleoside-diphosphate-sugar epimerase